MQALGKALHVTPRGLVVRVGFTPKLGQAAFDSAERRVGNIFDIFGPVKSPYVVIKPASGLSIADLGKLVNSDIYVGERYGKGRNTKSVSGMRRHKARA